MNVTAFKRRKEFGKTLASDIAHRMRSEIVTCRLKPGEVLKFDTLRLAYGASFTTLREALTCLAAEGLVVAEEQRGFKVAPVTHRGFDRSDARPHSDRRRPDPSLHRKWRR